MVLDLAQALEAASEPPAAEIRRYGDVPDPSVALGLTGVGLLYAYLAQSSGQERHAKVSERLLRQAVASLPNSALPPGLLQGATGVVWCVEHVGRLLGVRAPAGEDTDLAGSFDRLLETSLASAHWESVLDLVDGVVGIGVYALERLPRPTAVRCIERVLDRLEAAAVQHSTGVAWHSRVFEEVGDGSLAATGPVVVNVGMAHGMAGFIAFLSAICTAGHELERAGRLLRGAVEWLLAHRIHGDTTGGLFPAVVEPGRVLSPSRSAWCYGDPGVATALVSAAMALGQCDWRHAALQTGLASCAVRFRDSGVRDACLCHGASGLGHMLNRLFQATGIPEFGEAARRWLRVTVGMRRQGEGIGGFLFADVNHGVTTMRPLPAS